MRMNENERGPTMAEHKTHRKHATDDATARDEKGNKIAKSGRIREEAKKMIWCDAEHCTYYHDLYFDTKLGKWVMPDGHYCGNGEWVNHEDANDTDGMLVQKPSVTPEGKDLREAFGNASKVDPEKAEEQATAH
jgi:hypothetical protein